MTKIARFLSTCLLIGSMSTVAWAGETLGTGGPGVAPPAPTPAASTTDSTSPLVVVQDASATSAEVVNILVTWLVESLL